MLEVTQRLGGTNYVLWGGREGYDTLLNTDLKREGDQLARFLHLVAEHKHRIGFEGTLLIEPKPMEPTKHQYDYDSATIHGFLVRNGLEGEYQLNIEANHATLAGHSFHHEVAYAVAQRDPGLDRREPRRPPERLGHRPVPELRRGPGPAAVRDPEGRRVHDRRLQLRRQAAPPEQPIGPTCSTPTSAASTRSRGRCSSRPSSLESRTLSDRVEERYAGWSGTLGRAILDGHESLASLEAQGGVGRDRPEAACPGRQELLENLVNQAIWTADEAARVETGAGR